MDIKTLTPDDNGQVDWPALSPDRKAVVTVGVFDGMHQGHCAVIGKVVELARQTDSFAVVVLFDPTSPATNWPPVRCRWSRRPPLRCR